MKELNVLSFQSEYKVYIDDSFQGFKDVFAARYSNRLRKIFIATDDKVADKYKEILHYFQNSLNAKVFVFPAGEENKNFETIDNLYKFLLDNEAVRSSVLIAFGGGVPGDLAGFAASTYMRGIGFINIPTTLIAQVDSSIGGKVGYNYKNIKNIVGTFYNPDLVYISTHFLKTLSRDQLLDGMGEVIKYGMIKNEKLLNFIETNNSSILNLDEESIVYIVSECLKIKAEMIAEDYKDTGLRNILNFGHTIGHAIEIDSGYTIPHGMSVSLGILAALKLSENKLELANNVYTRIENLYKKLGIPIRYKVDNYASFLYAIKHDKKNSGSISFVLLEEIGRCKIKVPVSEEEILSALQCSICAI